MAILHGWRTCPRCEGNLAKDGAHAVCQGTCGSTYYANSAPCVSALVEDDDGRVLLARRGVEPYLGLWDPLGGFLEEGEHPIDGLRRELLEEAGVECEPVRFLGVWMDVYGDAPEAPATLNLYWTMRIVSGELIAADDVSELRWFAPDELPSAGRLAFSVVKDALKAWRAAKGELQGSG
jgi:ADP-ribose pyrophosphatase YjhB (NUDIX family)